MRIIGIIPARMASTRFPGKPLAKIRGMPMIGHVYQRCKLNNMLQKTYIATCDDDIRSYADSIGAPCVMTANTHERASDRAAEAVVKIESEDGKDVDVVMMIQCDEPLFQPKMLDGALSPFVGQSSVNIVNLMAIISADGDYENPNVVKVVVDQSGNALYLSREPIPSRKKGVSRVPMFKQLGLIAFRRDYLLRYRDLTPTPLEVVESVDMLRVLEHGDKLKMVISDHISIAVDTPEDLMHVERLMAYDKLAASYLA